MFIFIKNNFYLISSQENGHIQISGELDKNTLELMKKPRCGVGDKNLNVRRRKRYAFMSSKWHKNNLTWK